MKKFSFLFAALFAAMTMFAATPYTSVAVPTSTLDLSNPTTMLGNGFYGETAYALSDDYLVLSGYESYKSVDKQTWITTLSAGSSNIGWGARDQFKGSAYYTNVNYATLQDSRYIAYRVTGTTEVSALGVNAATTAKYLRVFVYDITETPSVTEIATTVAALDTLSNEAAGKDTVVLTKALSADKTYLVVATGAGASNSRLEEISFKRGAVVVPAVSGTLAGLDPAVDYKFEYAFATNADQTVTFSGKLNAEAAAVVGMVPQVFIDNAYAGNFTFTPATGECTFTTTATYVKGTELTFALYMAYAGGATRSADIKYTVQGKDPIIQYTCAEANALANGVTGELKEATVVYASNPANGAYTYVVDNTGAAMIYNQFVDYGLKVGDTFSGFQFAMSIYNTLPELTPKNQLADLTVTSGAAPEIPLAAAAPVAADVNKVLVWKNVAIEGEFTTTSKTTIKGVFGEDTIAFYNQFKIAQTFEAGKTYNITGAVSLYKGNVQVYFISAEEYVAPLPPATQRILAYGLKATAATNKYIFEFYANIAALEANLVFYKEGVLAGRVSAGNVVAGKNTVEVAIEDLPGQDNDEMTWAVELKAGPVESFAEIATGENLKKCHLAVDNSTESEYFGRIYITNRAGTASGGIYVYNQDYTINTANTLAGQPKWQSMGRVAVGNDGTVYIADWGDAHGGVYVMDPATLTADCFFVGTQNSDGLWTNASGVPMGSSTASVGVYGSGANTILYAINEDVAKVGDVELYAHGVNVYQIGQADGSLLRTWDKAPTMTYPLQANAAQMFVINANEHGVFFSCSRAAGQNTSVARSLQFYNKQGEQTYVALPEGATADLTGSLGGGCAVSRDLSELAIVDGSGNILLYEVTWTEDVPALTFKTKYETAYGAMGTLAFDYAGNLLATGGANYNNNTANKLIVYSMPTDKNEIIVPAQSAQIVKKAPAAPQAYNVTWDLDGGQLVFADKADMFAQFMVDNGVTDAMTLAEYKALDEPLAAPSGICVKLLTCKAMVDMPEKWGWLKTYIQDFSATQEGASALDDNCTSSAWRYAAAAFFTEGQRTIWPKSANFAEAGQVAAYSPAMNAAGYYYELPATMTVESAMPIVLKDEHEFLGWYNGENKVEAVSADCALKAKWNRLVFKVEFVAPFAYPNDLYVDDVYEVAYALQEAYNAAYNTSKDWAKMVDGQVYYNINGEWKTPAEAKGQACTVAKFLQNATYNTTNNLLNLVEADGSKFGWMKAAIVARRGAQGLATAMSEALYRKELSAMFLASPADGGWPASANWSDFTADSILAAWGAQVALPEEITEEYTLPTMYRKNYDFGGWFTDAEYTNAITKVGPKDNLTVYAKLTPNPYALLGIALDKKDTVELVMPATDQLTVIYTPDTAANKNVTWYTSDEAIATVANGLVTPVKPGLVKIWVVSEESEWMAEVYYNITAAQGAVTGVTLNEAAMTLELGKTATLVATIAPEEATNKNVTWSSSSNAVSVTQEGVIKADTVGSAVITVTTVDGGYTATCVVTVPEPLFTAINVEKVWELAIPTTLADIGDCRNGMGWNGKFYVTDKKAQKVRVFTKDGEDANAAIEFNAAADSLKIGTGIAIDDAGNIAVGTNFPNNVTGLYIIKNGTTTPVYIDLTGANALPQNGRCDQITAFGDFFSEAGGMVAYYTSGATQIQYAKIANGALVEVKAINAAVTKGASPSQVYALNADMTFVSHARGSAMQKYNGTEVATLSLKNVVNNDLGAAFFQVAGQNLAAYKVGTIHSSEFSIRNLDAEQFLVDKDGNSVFYFVDNKAASNNSYANFSKVEKINDYASYLYVFTSGKGAAMYKVYKDVAVTGVALDKTEATLNALETLQLTATVAPAEATVKDVTWGSSDENVATVDENGLVTAVAAGNATITVTTVEGGYTATCALTVSAVTYYRLTDVKQLVDGAKMIIVGGDSVTMGDKQNNNFKANAPVVVANNAIASLPTNATVITLGKVAKGYTMYTSYGYLVAGTSNSNYLKTVETIPTDNDLAYWTITVNPAATVIVNVDTNSKRNTIRYNTGSAVISAYATGQEDVQIFIDNNGSTTGWENINDENISVTKFIRNNQLYILRDGVLYNAQGAVVR